MNGESGARRDWSEREVERTVAAYFAMLRLDLLGTRYSKAEHRNALLPLLDRRNAGAVEFKHQNISAVLVGMGLPYIPGYKPLGNYQRLLAEKVAAYLAADPDFYAGLLAGPVLSPAEPPDLTRLTPEQVVEDPPGKLAVPAPADKPWLSLKGRRIDFAERDARNRHLGKLGEAFVLWYERGRLKAAGRDDLAARVRWVADEVGDGLGFDILSFDAGDEAVRYVEVKATGQGKFSPFYVTDLEVRCSDDVGDRFHLARVFELGRQPRLYVLQGSLAKTCHLAPALYKAGVA